MLFEGAQASLLTLHEALGPDAGTVLVGGAVRDLLLGRPSPDCDLASALLPGEVLARAEARGLRVIPTGLKHGTVTVMLEGRPFEITTFRGDGDYSDGRRPDQVRLGVGLTEDLARRDFTINAMALPIAAVGGSDWPAQVLDPFGGRDDLKAGLIRAVGDPMDRFGEDGLRSLRACRFAAQLAFDIEDATLAAVPRRLDVTAKVAVERVLAELTKLLCGADPGKGLSALLATGLLRQWLPELQPMVGCGQGSQHHRWPVWEHTLEVVRRVPADPAQRWAALLHDAGKPARRTTDERGVHFHGHEGVSEQLAQAILARLRASHALVRQVLALIRHHGTHPEPAWSDAACRRFLRRLADDGLDLAAWGAFRLGDQSGKGFEDSRCGDAHAHLMVRLRALAAAAPPLNVRALALDGGALMALAGRTGGPWLKELQGALLEAVLEDPGRNTPEGLTALARTWLGS